MAPFKFEEDIKSVLEKRTIKPTKLAWEELEKSLDKDHGNNKKKPFWWIGIAASIVGILWIAISFFNQDNVIVEPIIVDVTKDNFETPTLMNTSTKEQVIIKEEVIIDRPIISKKEVLIAEETKPKTIKKEMIPVFEKGLDEEIKKEELIAKTDIIIPGNSLEEEKQLQQVAAQIAVLEKENATDAEIDLLLKNAQQKMTNQKFKESGMSVSAYALLFEVEEELDPTFKEKVFKILSENYSSVKNAVAQRNE